VFNGRDEDFGIAPVEALASGTPVLGVAEGMTQYQVIPSKNGYLFDRSADGGTIRTAIDRFERDGVSMTAEEIERTADRFSKDAFRKGMHEAIATALDAADVTPDWYPPEH
jgi:glycosyltransferase involved in cell wall biosynthesis